MYTIYIVKIKQNKKRKGMIKMRKITITVESLREEIAFLEDLKQGFINSSERHHVRGTQRTIDFKKEQMMDLMLSGETAIEILV